MALLDRFRAQPRQKHPDPVVRLEYVGEIPLEQRDVILSMAREDEDPRVRKAAVAKLMDPRGVAEVMRNDPDEHVRDQAIAMLGDIALEAFEGITEADSFDAVDALTDGKTLARIAKTAAREIVALRALSRISDPHALGSIARHGAIEAARRDALELLRERADRAEMLGVAMNSEYKDTALQAVDLLSDVEDLEQIATRSRNKSAAKRARGILREAQERAVREAAASDASRAPAASDLEAAGLLDVAVGSTGGVVGADVETTVPSEKMAPVEESRDLELADGREAERGRAEEERRQREEQARISAEQAASREYEGRRSRLGELAQDAMAAAADADLAAARKRFATVRSEWTILTRGMEIEPALASPYANAEAQLVARETEAREAQARARREALTRMQQLVTRVEALASKPELTLKTADRALHDIREALAHLPPLPSRQDADDAHRRLKAAQAALQPRAQELREADDWQRWANAGVQEQLCAKMEILASLDDPEKIASEVRELQRQWRLAAAVPRAKAEALWHRFKAAHDVVWPRCEAHFAAQAVERDQNLARKTALCEKAEALADSTRWIQTAEEIKALQAEWKSIGPVSRGQEKAIWDRFRGACDRFFTRRHDDLVRRKATWAENLAKKEALSVRAEVLAESTDWDAAAAEIKRLQADWKTIGPVKKSRSEAIWQRFRGAGDRFFTRYAQRHDVTRAERVAAREAICDELESLGAMSESEPAADLVARVRALRSRWQQEVAARGVEPDRAKALDARFAEAFAQTLARWPGTFGGTDLDPDANRKRMESLVKRVEDLATSLAASPGATAAEESLSPTTRLAAMLKEALAANTIGGKVEDDSRRKAALEEVRAAQAGWSKIGPVAEEIRRPLADRFQRACRRITEPGGNARSSGPGGPAQSDRMGKTPPTRS